MLFVFLLNDFAVMALVAYEAKAMCNSTYNGSCCFY